MIKFYPANFPVHLEQPLIDLLLCLQDEFKKTIPKDSKKCTRLILNELKKPDFQKYFKDIKPSNWWLYFIVLRHHELFSKEFTDKIKPFLLKTKTRSISGIVPLTLFTSGTGCPFNCVYCPNEPGVPKSYFSDEPAVMRAIRNNYDPYKQTISRLIMFYLSGHPIDKVEIIIKGGTFSFYSKQYRTHFVKRIYDACNTDIENLIATGQINALSAKTFDESQKINETAPSRIIGINIETRPDFINEKELWYLRKLGVTHVEIGVQMPDDHIYERIKRGHRVEHVVIATKLLKDFGFKVGYHLMPNLPGSSPENDSRLMSEIFKNENLRPDHLKLYPTTVTSHTKLAEWFENGTYKPYPIEDLVDVIVSFKTNDVPPWVRIGRLTRDITTTVMKFKQFMPNLREVIQEKMHTENKVCHCIRCREIKDGTVVGTPHLRVLKYYASGSTEYFLEYIDESEHSLGFLRLRLLGTNTSIYRYIEAGALVRELHVYGKAATLGERDQNKTQHKSYGKLLLKAAEQIAQKEGVKKVAIISGVGVREYYQKPVYSLTDTYMIKSLS